jgi:hypothetical protein
VKFLLDHDVPDGLSYLLEQLGHEVTRLRKALPGDSSDEASSSLPTTVVPCC